MCFVLVGKGRLIYLFAALARQREGSPAEDAMAVHCSVS